MVETVLRAVASLIVVTCLILWLGRSASTGGFAAKLFARFGSTGAPLGRGAKTKQSKAKPRSANLLKTWGAKFTGTASGVSSPAPVMTVAARQVLMGTSGVAVVDIDGQRLVLGVTESQVSLITTLPTPGAVAVDQELAPEFAACPKESAYDQDKNEAERWPNICDVAELEAEVAQLDAEVEEKGATDKRQFADFVSTTEGTNTFAGGQIYPVTPEPLPELVEASQEAPMIGVVDFESKLRDSIAAQEMTPLDASESRSS